MSDLDDEIRSHLEHEIDDNVARGMTRAQAEAAAYRKFGNRTRVKEAVWRLRPGAWLDGLRQDLRYALRMMRKSWGFTAIAVASLALGIGGNTALFSLVDRLMLRTLPVREPERLVHVTSHRYDRAEGWMFSYPIYRRIREMDLFEGVAGSRGLGVEVEWSGEKRNHDIVLVTGDYFPTLGVQPVIGRLLDSNDDSPPGGEAAVISYTVWEREFQANPAVLGQRFRWDRGLFTVVGVLPPVFHGVQVGRLPEIFLPFHAWLRAEPRRRGRLLTTDANNVLLLMARLRPGVSAEQIEPVLTDRMLQFDDVHKKFTLLPGSTGVSTLRNQFGYGLWILLGLSGVVLAAACANLASLQLLRADARRREMSIRAAAGASTGRIIRQWFTESALLAVAGGLAGLLLSAWITEGLLAFLPGGRSFFEFRLDGRVLAASLVVTVMTALVFGVLPGWRAARAANWKEGWRGSTGGRGARWVKSAMALQLAASLVLILGAALFARSLQELVRADYGFGREGLVVAKWNGRIPRANMGAFLDEMRALPQVKAASLAWYAPMGGVTYYDQLKVPGYAPAPGEDTTAYYDAVSPGFFETLGIPLLAGRDFDGHDTVGAPRVAIVSESLARRYFGRLDVTGEAISAGDKQEWAWTQQLRIAGVVGNTHLRQLTPEVRQNRQTSREQMYIPLLQVPDEHYYYSAVVRRRPGVTPAALVAALRGFAGRPEIQAEFTAIEYETTFSGMIRQDRLLAILAAVFGGLGAALALIGLYGAMAYTVSRRTAELGVRMALGARPAQIARMVLRETGALAALGLVIGIPLGVLASRLVAARLYQVKPLDPWAIAAVALVMLGVSLAAALVPAWRAARVDPAVALRAE